jgi:hypothetical protein
LRRRGWHDWAKIFTLQGDVLRFGSRCAFDSLGLKKSATPRRNSSTSGLKTKLSSIAKVTGIRTSRAK